LRQATLDLGAEVARKWQVLTVASAGAFMGFLDVTIVNIAFPDIQRDFSGTSLAELSWILNAYAIVFAALLVPAGRIADRIGRRRGFAIGLIVFAVASALCAAAPSPELLVAARVIQAGGAAFLVPTSLALLLPAFPLTQRATAVGLWGATGAIAAATGPSLGGVLVDAGGWRWVFLVNLPLAVITLVAAFRVLDESREPDPTGRPDLAGAIMVMLGIGALALALVKGNEWGWGNVRTVAAFAIAAVLVPVVVWRSRRVEAPIVEPALLRVRAFAVANVATVLFAASFYAMLLGNVLFLTQVWDYGVLDAGLAITPGPIMAAVFAGPAGALADRFGQRAVAVPGALVYSAAFGWYLTHVGPEAHYARDLLPGMLAGGAGVGLTFPTLSSAAAAALPPARFATGSAVLGMTRQIGAVLGIALLVVVLGTPDPADPVAAFDDAWALMLAGGLGTALTAAALGRVRARTPTAATAEAPA
jgi:EmrB/QacA subfamily drug resistance transporter